MAIGMEPEGSYIRWRDLDTHREAEASRRHMDFDRLNAKIDRNAERIDKLESVIDQQRGARALVWALIGTNVLAVVLVLADLVGRG